MNKCLALLYCSVLMLSSCSALGVKTDTASTQNGAYTYKEMKSQFGRLIGKWDIKQYSRNDDGSWNTGTKASWDFEYTLNGHAIQDYWIAPASPDPAISQSQQSVHGTTLRVYKPEQNIWEIIWVANDDKTFTPYKGWMEDNGNMIMTGKDPNYPEYLQRITYYNIGKDSWDWKLEYSKDNVAWLEVVKINATRSSQ